MEEYREIKERDIETRENGSQVYREPYSESAIDRLRKLVVKLYEQGERKYYSILVDGEIVVPRNADGRKFTRYLEFIDSDTKTIEVKMFYGYSPNCNRYIFIMNKGLKGVTNEVDVQAQIRKALEEQKLQTELKKLREENAKKDKKIKKYKANQETGMDKFRDVVEQITGVVGAFGLKAPGALQGVPEPETEVEIEAEEMEMDTEHSEEELIYNQILQSVGKKGLKKALRVMAMLSAHPELEDKLTEVLNQKKEENGEA